MRIIKYRGWGIDAEMMHQWEQLQKIDKWWNHDAVKLMQFTGLLDKSGIEIYEGDIVKIHNYKEIWKRGEPKIDWGVFEIRWNRYLWSFNNSVISKPLADYDTTDLMPYDIEIIGNIYENPDLIRWLWVEIK